MSDDNLDEIYKVKQFHANKIDSVNIGLITEKDKFLAAKQILLGLAVLYVITLVAYLIRPHEGDKLLNICITVFPSLATLILVSYFKERHS
ncbi:MAG TPA: hypothetical protein VK559_04745 [Ferruginibacter sp.]|nr:hypothetical protein [Ferruginibacter sp.]